MADPELPMLPDGTGLRFRHQNGFEYVATVDDGRIVGPNGDRLSPSGAAREVDKVVRPDGWHDGWNGWREWEWFSGDGWRTIDTLR